MLRVMPRRLLCKGDVSRVRDGPAFFVLLPQCICTQMRGIGLLAWQVALQAGAFSDAARSESARKPACAKEVESGMARLFV